MELLLIRHGEMAGDPFIKPQRPVEGCLSPEGIAQAEGLGDVLTGTHIDLAICSSFGRAIQTAEVALAGRGVPFQIVDELHEWMPSSETQGLASTEYEAIMGQDREHFAEMTYKTELGEGAFDMYARIIPPFMTILNEQGVCPRYGGFVIQPDAANKTLAFFAHGGTLNVLLSHLLRVHPFPVGVFNFQLTGMARICFHEKAGVYYPSLVIPAPNINEMRQTHGDDIQAEDVTERHSENDRGLGGDRVVCSERQGANQP